jgi:hypothetical protein
MCPRYSKDRAAIEWKETIHLAQRALVVFTLSKDRNVKRARQLPLRIAKFNPDQL